MKPSTSLLPLARRPKTIATKRTCCHLQQQRYASTSTDVQPTPGSADAEIKKNEANYKRMQMMRDPPNLTAAAVGIFAHYITPIKRKPAHPEGSFKRNIPILKNINAKRFWSDRANLNMNKAVNAAITQRLGKDWVHGLSDAARSAYFRVNQAIQSGKVDSLYSICSAEFQNDLANRRRVTMLNGWKAQWHVVPNSKMEEDDSLFQFNSVFGPKKEPQDILMKTICLRSSPDPMDVKEMMIQALVRFRSNQTLSVIDAQGKSIFWESDEDVVEYYVFQRRTGADDRWILVKQLHEGEDAETPIEPVEEDLADLTSPASPAGTI